ncbi:dTDP-4-dehydrorhamnose 3,5-epimerase [Rhizobium sp. BK376]|uniref:dTDP-4-dehydrorhamnose 3,5-epimerase n=1 Tax=Rhizobium sp. BK376 TaxID=2512149 RepID=UPI00104F1183|nr:dTDP-4-dehydrorhamnose 3,5-epimerase [Rhizobium sp. BK376]TCR71855.1 dTDP-4-dehydrorhamnose 3,5-epimerase [Rhizobium sp. BK376]
MKFERLSIPDVVLIKPSKFGDTRGYFMETYRQDLFAEQIGPMTFLQDNQSKSVEAGTVRGLHFQLDPMSQGKLVRCIAGALLDVAVDIRKGSPTYGKWVSAELTCDNGLQLWVPPGFAHGFCTLVANTEISYKVTNYYSPENDRGLRWDDPIIAIDWPVKSEDAVLSTKDAEQPSLSALGDCFFYH